MSRYYKAVYQIDGDGWEYNEGTGPCAHLSPPSCGLDIGRVKWRFVSVDPFAQLLSETINPTVRVSEPEKQFTPSISFPVKVENFEDDSEDAVKENIKNQLKKFTIKELEDVGWTEGLLIEYERLTPEGHELFQTGDGDVPAVLKDRNGDVVLDMCRACGRAESQLSVRCDRRVMERPWEKKKEQVIRQTATLSYPGVTPSIRVCPALDRECGIYPGGWCMDCPNHKKNGRAE